MLVRLEGLGVAPDERGALPGWEATPHQRLERLLRETGVPTGCCITDDELRLVHAPRGETSGWLAVPAALARRGRRAADAGRRSSCCSAHFGCTMTRPTARLPALLKASREAQAAVSTQLATQVLGALHELLRGLHAADPRASSALARSNPAHLYEGLLTVLLRLVFLLYAEDRDLIPSRTDGEARALYDQGYGVRALHARLLEDAARNPDTMDERRGAWGRLLALFRLVHEGDGRHGFAGAAASCSIRRSSLPGADAAAGLNGNGNGNGNGDRHEPTIVMATVKGDVHDIGKNIVGVVLACNGYRIVDLGVMVPWTQILEAARREEADAIGLSGLITPSLEEMRTVAQEMEREHMTLPLLIGGATTSRAHTAVRLEPAYSGPVVHVQDASRAVGVVRSLLDVNARDAFVHQTRESYTELRRQFADRDDRTKRLTIVEARTNRLKLPFDGANAPIAPTFLGSRSLPDVSIEELSSYIDWTPFFAAWELPGHYPEILDDPRMGAAARSLFDDAQAHAWPRHRGAPDLRRCSRRLLARELDHR